MRFPWQRSDVLGVFYRRQAALVWCPPEVSYFEWKRSLRYVLSAEA